MKKERYPAVIAAIRKYESGASKNRVCKEFHIHDKEFQLYYNRYKAGGELAVLEQREQHLTYEQKLLIVRDIQENGLSLPRASEKYLLPYTSMRKWLFKYEQEGEDGLKRKRRMPKKKEYSKAQLDELESLRKRNEYLEAENALLKKVKALVEEREARLRETGRKPSRN